MKIKTRDIVWKDNLKILLLVIIPIFFIFFLIYLALISNENLVRIIYIIFMIPFLYLIYKTIIFQRTYIIDEGIFIHDRFLHKGFFLNWDEILNMLIIKKLVSTGKYWAFHKELVIKTKDNKKYTGTIFNLQGFVLTLKKLNKYHLLDKTSKYK